MSATLKGLLGGASSRIFGGTMGRNSSSSKSDDTAPQQEELWFTGLDDFKPICHMLHRGRYMSAYFACANKTGQHFLLKKYDKRKQPALLAILMTTLSVARSPASCRPLQLLLLMWLLSAAACISLVHPDKMLPAEERGVRRAIAFSELLQHPNLVRMMGTWESDDTIFVGE